MVLVDRVRLAAPITAVTGPSSGSYPASGMVVVVEASTNAANGVWTSL